MQTKLNFIRAHADKLNFNREPAVKQNFNSTPADKQNFNSTPADKQNFNKTPAVLLLQKVLKKMIVSTYLGTLFCFYSNFS